jgi:hypothetical protein
MLFLFKILTLIKVNVSVRIRISFEMSINIEMEATICYKCMYMKMHVTNLSRPAAVGGR